jgi:hypothetical protein
VVGRTLSSALLVVAWTSAVGAQPRTASVDRAPGPRGEPAAPVESAPRALPVAQLAERLLRRWAPVYVQHVDPRDRGADRPTRIDFDGNWDATDNWSHQRKHGTQVPPAVYGAAIMTATHVYLTYTLFYPRDWSRLCVPLICHDNDLETVQLIVRRDGDDGTLQQIRSKLHHRMREIAGAEVARDAEGHPVMRVERRGHGIIPCRQADPACEARTGRLVYKLGDEPSMPPDEARGQLVRYALLSLRDTLWLHRARDRAKLWARGDTGPLYYHGRERGRLGNAMGAAMATKKYAGGVRPPWAIKGRSGKRGDWFLDPATDTGEPADYVYNPFLDDLAQECMGPACPPAPREPSRVKFYARLGAPYGAVVVGTVLLTTFARSRISALPF